MHIVGPQLCAEWQCEQVLRSLPQWFGIEEALQMYVRDSAALPGFAVDHDGQLIAFITLKRHFAQAWEVHCVAVHAAFRQRGIGRRLFEHAENWLIGQGARLLQIKTIAATHPDPYYAQTRAFYAALGYLPLEVFPELWSARHPCLQMIKWLDAAATPRKDDGQFAAD